MRVERRPEYGRDRSEFGRARPEHVRSRPEHGGARLEHGRNRPDPWNLLQGLVLRRRRGFANSARRDFASSHHGRFSSLDRRRFSNSDGRRFANPNCSVLRGLCILVCGLTLAGCVSSYGTLEGVVVEDEAVSGNDMRGIEVIRGDAVIPAELNMVLQKDDEINTAANTRAVIHVLDDAYEVTIGPATEIVLENPSIFVKIGKVFYKIRKQLEEIREELKVENEFASAGAEGTKFLFAVGPQNEVDVAVLEGSVRVSPRNDTMWTPVVYGPLEWGIIRADRPPERQTNLTRGDIQSQIAWAQEVDVLTAAEIPSLPGMIEAEARRILADLRLEIGDVTYTVTGEVDAGVVISQDPAPGAARVGDPVDLVVEQVSVLVPDVSNLPVAEARSRLRQLGLEPGRISESLREGESDVVTGQNPRAGRRVERGTEVHLDVTLGGVRVPRLVNVTRVVAERSLRAAGLQIGEVSQVRARQRPGTVVGHQPTAGTLVRSGSEVDLVLARGCIVPSLDRLTERQAIIRLRDEGLRAGDILHLESGDTVTGQEPDAGTQIECNSPVDFTIGVIG